MPRTFLHELKRRKVYRVAVVYAIVGWLLIQIATQVFPFFHIPDWSVRLLVLLVLAGFPVALVLAWAFDATPHGIVRTDPDGQPVLRRSRRGTLAVGAIGLLLAIVVGAGYWAWHREPAPRTVTASNATRATDAAAGHAATATSAPASANATKAAARSPDAAQRLRLQGVQTRTAEPARRVSDRDVANQSGAAITQSAATAAASGLRSASVPIAAQPIPAKSIAVLPFENLSTDKGNAYFADGMQDLILTKLADIGDLKVISRTSTMQYGSHPQNLKVIAQQLGVATILEGSVQKAGKQVLINVQLIDARTDGHIWAESYTRTLDNIFGVEGEVAGKVAQALNAKLTASETAAVARVPTTNPQAYTLYLKALHGMGLIFTVRGLDAQMALMKKNAAYLRQAIVLDPNFAAAYAHLSILEVGLHTGGGEDVSIQTAMAHARKALALQPNLAVAHFTVGMVLSNKGEFAQGLQETQKAAQLAPDNANIADVLTHMYAQMGAWQQADKEAHKAVSVDPRNGVNYQSAAHISLQLRHYADARKMLERGLAVDPDDMLLHARMGGLLELLGDFAGARAYYAQLPDTGYNKFGALARAWMLSRNCTEALKAARQMPSPPKHFWNAGWRDQVIGRCDLASGDKDHAQAMLAKGRAEIQAALQKHSRSISGLYNELAYIEMALGHRDAALQTIDKVIALDIHAFKKHRPSGSSVTTMYMAANSYETKAEVLAHFGDAKGATDILRQLFQTQGTGNTISPALLKLDPVWDPIRKDPRFQALLKKYGGDAEAKDAGDDKAAAHD